MTTIVAVETPEGVTFASDTRMTGGAINDGWISKVFSNKGIVWGIAGYLRVSQLVQHADMPEPPKTKNAHKIDAWVTNVLGPLFTAANDDFAAGDRDLSRRSGAIVVVHGRVYELEPSGGWTRSLSGHYAIGSGARYALGALAAGASSKKAIKIASRYDPGTNNDVRKIVIRPKA